MWHLSLENTMFPARAHTQGAQARRCYWLTSRHVKEESILGFAYEVEARPCSCCNTDIPLAQGASGTMGWTLTTVHICCSVPVSPWQRYVMGCMEWHKCPAEGTLLLAYVESSPRWLWDFSSEAAERGRKVMLCLCFVMRPASPPALQQLGGTQGSLHGHHSETLCPPACWGLQRRISLPY